MKSKSVIAMDVGYWVKTQDGNVAFKKRTFLTWLAIVLLGLFLLAIIGSVVAILFGGRDIDAKLSQTTGQALFVCIPLTMLMVALIRGLRKPSIYINATSKMLEIGRGDSARPIPYSRLSHLIVVHRSGYKNVPAIDILGILDNEEKIPFGTVSGAKAKVRTRAEAVTRLIVDTIGTQVKVYEDLTRLDNWDDY